MSLEKAIQENTAAMLKLAESNEALAAMFISNNKVTEIANSISESDQPTEEQLIETLDKIKESTTEKKKAPAKPKEEPKAEVKAEVKAKEEPKEEPEASKVTGDDLRKVAGKCIAEGKKAEFKAVLTQFDAANITVFEKDENSDMAGMLAALEEVAGCKLAEIAD